MGLIKRNRNKNLSHITISKRIPILTLDQRWHTLFPDAYKSKKIKELEKELGELVKEQGQLNNNIKEYMGLKKKMMAEIMNNMESAYENNSEKAAKKLETNKKYITEINEKIMKYEERLDVLPNLIKTTNEQLLKLSLESCYLRMKKNKTEITHLEEWIGQTKEALKNNIINKQEIEEENNAIYTYMHDLLGYEVIDEFDKDYGDKDD